MFMGPLEVSKPWSNQGVEGARKFLNRVWTFFTEPSNIIDGEGGALEQIYHKSVKKITDDFEKLAFNTAISQMMIFVNAVYKADSCPKEFAEGFIRVLSPIAPHICEEIWESLGGNGFLAMSQWPEYDEEKTKDNEIEIAVQISGKLKGTIWVTPETTKDEAIALAKADEKIASLLEGKQIMKEIYIPGKIVNIVAK